MSRLFTETTAKVTENETATTRSQSRKHSAEEERPCHVAVNEDDGSAEPFIDIVEPPLSRIEFSQRKGIFGSVQPETMIIHDNPILRWFSRKVEPSCDIPNTLRKALG